MPKLWMVKSGRRPNSQSGPSHPATLGELESLCQGDVPVFMGDQPIGINENEPSDYPTHVVAEIDVEEERSALFPKPGFYVIPGLTPTTAAEILEAIRESDP